MNELYTNTTQQIQFSSHIAINASLHLIQILKLKRYFETSDQQHPLRVKLQ